MALGRSGEYSKLDWTAKTSYRVPYLERTLQRGLVWRSQWANRGFLGSPTNRAAIPPALRQPGTRRRSSLRGIALGVTLFQLRSRSFSTPRRKLRVFSDLPSNVGGHWLLVIGSRKRASRRCDKAQSGGAGRNRSEAAAGAH